MSGTLFIMYRFCKDAYLYKYDHADEYYNNILNKDKWTKDVLKYLKTSDNVDERLLFYLKGDANRTDKSFTLEEQKLIKDNYRAYKNGEIMQSKNLYDMAAQLQEDQSVYACEYTVKVEGQKIIIDARIILPTGYFDTKYDRFELDFSDCCSSAFGSLYISNEVFAEKMFEYSKYRYENGWIDSLVTSLREDQVEEVINSDEFNRSIAQNIENYNELSEEEKNLIIDEYRKYLYITADCQDGIMSIYERDRTTKIEKANKEWDQALLALSLMALMAVPFNPTMAGVAGAALGYINGAKQCLQGNYYEGGTEIVLTTAAIAAPFVLEKVSNAKAVRALKNADEILDVSDNIDDAERLARNVEELKNVPDNEIDGFLELRKIESEKYTEFIGKTSYGKSSGNLNWDTIVSKKGENRIDHINRHAVPDITRETHGVFNGNPVDMVNEAWEQRFLVEPMSDGMGGTIYNIPYKNAGYESGYINTGVTMDYITIITMENSNDIISAFPSFGNYHK